MHDCTQLKYVYIDLQFNILKLLRHNIVFLNTRRNFFLHLRNGNEAIYVLLQMILSASKFLLIVEVFMNSFNELTYHIIKHMLN